MRLATVKRGNKEVAAIVTEERVVLIEEINKVSQTNWSETIMGLLESGQFEQIKSWYDREGEELLTKFPSLSRAEMEYAPLYRTPRKIWGIGMNYVAVRSELGGLEESDPVFFMKPDTSIIGEGDVIEIPPQSKRTTAEAELAIIIGKKCKNISEDEVQDVVAGYTIATDVTAADIHAENPRFIQRAKSFDTFFSFGPVLLTKDEVQDIASLQVTTALNGNVHFENKVENMICSPAYIVSFLSHVTTLLPGDIIMTGTPGATVINQDDVVECKISGFETLTNVVVQK
ncbi:fumarylacetoacetate hydrolase family protein [Alkalihalobacillus sp. MEB130]|uniref:fumarylacetoacetate hydrolase family protein n=1 Tax=Alkalihalobacillus sp. MEB130 TaxID=2976704 RepID=UPI0028E00126|nr:fumarylacetoacetate hydrolase family protein [Alkalihalobacillus sp. MEB130]MDT8860890.1 fumarylacetoacetate hydrolase family protein [Alkalihalobacillus sp. MEB130]